MTNKVIRAAAVGTVALLCLMPIGALAHESREAAGTRVVVGWAEEPAFAGFKNAVSFRVTQGGRPVEGLQMKVEVIFGQRDATEKTDQLELQAAFGDPGHYTAPLIPTRPGTYTFHITGAMPARAFDEFFTSSETTFDGIEEAKDVQFPAKDPSLGELATRAERLDTRAQAARQAADEAANTGRLARTLSYIALGLAVVGLLLAIAAVIRSRKAR